MLAVPPALVRLCCVFLTFLIYTLLYGTPGNPKIARAEPHEATRLQLDPFLTRLTTLASAAALRRVVPEFRVNLHELNRVAEF